MALVAVGAAAATHGPTGLRDLGILAWSAWPVILIALAATALIRSVVPHGAIGGPILLGLIGVAALSLRHGVIDTDQLIRLAGGCLLISGGWIVMAASPRHDSLDPVWRRTALLFSKDITVADRVTCPEHLGLLTVAARITVDLTDAAPPSSGCLEIAISCWGGSVELSVPPNWALLAGRLEAARGVRFLGTLDHPEPVRDPRAGRWLEKLSELAEARARSSANDPSAPGPSAAIVLHVTGIGGTVSVPGRRALGRV